MVLLATLALMYFSIRIVFYFPAKAVGSDISLSESFSMTRGYFWKIVLSYVFAVIGFISYWLKPIVIWLICSFVFLVAVLIWLVLGGVDPDSIGVILTSNPIIEFIFELPFNLYSFPLMTMIYVTITSNFYLYAVQNPRRDDGHTN